MASRTKKTAPVRSVKKSGQRIIDAAESKERILQAALQEFAANGFAGSRMDSIARRARANKAMLHYYFGNKQNLYRIVLERIFGGNEGEEEFVRTVEKSGLSLAQKIHLFVHIMIKRHCSKNSNVFHKIMSWEMAEGRTHLKKMAKQYMIPRIVILEQLIERGNSEGIFRCDNPILAVWSLISQVAFYYIQQETYADTDIYDRLYLKVKQDEFLSFIVRNFYMSISPPGKPIQMTNLPKEIIQAADKYLAELTSLA